MQSYRFVQALGAKQGWPSGWYQQIRPNQIQAAITSAGGAPVAAARLGRTSAATATPSGATGSTIGVAQRR